VRGVRFILLTVAALAAVALVAMLGGGRSERAAEAKACPEGQTRVRAEGGEERDRRGEPGNYESHFVGKCIPIQHPESNEDLQKFNDYAAMRQGSDSPKAFSRAVRQRQAMERSPIRMAGAGARWHPYGHGPMIGDDPKYPNSLGDGFGKIEGRVNDLLYVPQTKKLYAAVAQGGVWRSTNLGESWKPIGDNLPIQSTGSINWTKARGGTLIVATGDHAFSNDYAGVGAYWSTNDGRSCHRSKGSPGGALSFRVAVDPNNPSVVYLATGFGLYRSTDAGRSFTNVNLPTGACHGNSHKRNCFFANIVTDVAVQPKDSLGHKGGAVIAAVGWRDGVRPNLAGVPEAPANGLYRSDSGRVGTFKKVPDSAGFTPTDRAGRTEFGVSDGPGQDSRYLYAVAQDSNLFNQTTSGGETDVPLVGTPSVLDAIYVSPDFGATWKKMESRQEFFNPANGSALSQLVAADIAPGYQVTYNEFIKPDPTRKSPTGVPTRVILGMEEVWQNVGTVLPQSGHSQFQVIGEYTANGGACLVVPAQCGGKQNIAGNTTTHPDQHDGALVPDGKGGVTLFMTDDGGVYKQHVNQGQEFDNLHWGDGANKGFETLLPYGAAMAKDGTVYAGLQDNGELKIDPNGVQHTVFVGDGTNALVEPNNSKNAWDELPNGDTNVTEDGGIHWSGNDPGLKDADFVAPLVMDPRNGKHVMDAGRDIAETTAGTNTTVGCSSGSDPQKDCAPTDWKYVYDLGTRSHPGDPNAVSDTPTDTDPPNHATTAWLDGPRAYIGFCGDCDPVKRHRKFENGFATNVGGSKPPKAGTRNGWHITAAKGLPNRLITGVVSDPKNPKTVYVTLGASATRYWAPLGSMGESAIDAGHGHVFKSTDAGKHFHNISGDLPNVQTTDVLVRNNQLVVGTAIGVFVSSSKSGGHYGLLGRGLPPVAIYSLNWKPGGRNLLVAATYGRGVWTYRFTKRHVGGRPPRVPPSCVTSRPYARFSHTSVQAARRVHGRARLRLRGIARVRKGCGSIRHVQVSIARTRGGKCRYLKAGGRFTQRLSCRKPRFVGARRTAHWRFVSRRSIPTGRYRARVRSIDSFARRSPISKRRHTDLIIRRRP
jgi:hypothetical protein